jgi:hypothetical protein
MQRQDTARVFDEAWHTQKNELSRFTYEEEKERWW